MKYNQREKKKAEKLATSKRELDIKCYKLFIRLGSRAAERLKN